MQNTGCETWNKPCFIRLDPHGRRRNRYEQNHRTALSVRNWQFEESRQAAKNPPTIPGISNGELAGPVWEKRKKVVHYSQTYLC